MSDALRDDLELLWAVLSESDMQVDDDGRDVRVTFHAKGDGYTPFATFTTRNEAERLRRLLKMSDTDGPR